MKGHCLFLLFFIGVTTVNCDCDSGSPIQVLSDVDDTIFSGGSGTGNTDDSQPKHTFYDGVLEFYLALSLGFGKNAIKGQEQPLGPILLSARPFEGLVSGLRKVVDLRRLAAVTSFSHNDCVLADSRVSASNQWDIQGVLLGRKGDLLNSSKKRNEKFGQSKFDNFKNFAAGGDPTKKKRWFQFPGSVERTREDRCYIFVGDDGQGDEAAGVSMLSQYGPPEVRARGFESNPYLVKAVFIHNVSKLNKKTGGYFLNRDDPLCTEYGKVLDYMHYFDTFYGAAASAYTHNLIDIFALARVLRVPCRACELALSKERKIKLKARVNVVRWCQMSGQDLQRGVENIMYSASLPPKVSVFPVSINTQRLRGRLLDTSRSRGYLTPRSVGVFDGSLFITNRKGDDDERTVASIRNTLTDEFPSKRKRSFVDAVKAMNDLSQTILAIDRTVENRHGCDGVGWIIEAMQILITHPTIYSRDLVYKIRKRAEGCAEMFVENMSTEESSNADRCVAELVSEEIYPPYRDFLNEKEVPNGPRRYQFMRKPEDADSQLYHVATDLDYDRQISQAQVMRDMEEYDLRRTLLDLQAISPQSQAQQCSANQDKHIEYPDDESDVSDLLTDDYDTSEDDDEHSWVDEEGDDLVSRVNRDFPDSANEEASLDIDEADYSTSSKEESDDD